MNHPRQHSQILAALYILYGIFHGFALCLMLIIGFVFLGRISNFSDAQSLQLGIFSLATFSSLPAGYGLVKRRSWATTAVKIASGAMLMIGIYTFTFLLLNQSQFDIAFASIYFIYCLICVALGAYSIWFLYYKPAA